MGGFRRRSPRPGYLAVIALVLATYAVSLASSGRIGTIVALLMQAVSVRIVLGHAGARRWLRAAGDLAVVLAVILAVTAALTAGRTVDAGALLAVYIVTTLLYLVCPAVILRDVLSAGSIDGESLAGATAAYLQIGLFFGFTFRLVDAVSPVPVFGEPVTIGDILFFSFITLTTTGYGNIVPSGWAGETLAVIEVVIGQLFLVVAIGKIVTAWVPRRSAGPGRDAHDQDVHDRGEHREGGHRDDSHEMDGHEQGGPGQGGGA